MSFFFILSLFPFFLIFAAIVGWLPSTTLWHSLAHWIIRYLPPESQEFVFNAILDLRKEHAGYFSLGLIAMLWSASSGVVSVMESLSVAHGGKDIRGFWEKRVIAFCAIFIAMIFCTASFGLLGLGHWTANTVFGEFILFAPVRMYSQVTRWTVTLILMCLGIDLVNYLLPAMRRPWRWLPPSTIFIALTYVAASAMFNFYTKHFRSFPSLYGALAGFVVLMLWIYIANLILLIGAETERALEHPKPEAAA